jgi:SAM-dependent methyltransferase
MNCRHCGAALNLQFVDLGSAPPSNAYLTTHALQGPEAWLPLRVLTCTCCWLVQTEDYAGAEQIFTDDYAYFSSFSKTWLDHAESYVGAMVDRFRLSSRSRVVELAANDGYLLQFIAARGIPCLGVEPTASTAASARAKGLEIVQEFFGVRLARTLAGGQLKADLVVANNVLAHVPDINDFLSGITILLSDGGVATFEFPHLLNLVKYNQFDTIYHEHFSYLSLTAIRRIFEHNGLAGFDVEELPTHGGSLRVYADHLEASRTPSHAVEDVLQRERSAGLDRAEFYSGFQWRVERAKNDFLHFLLQAKESGKQVAAYGAAAKGNTLLNYAGVRRDLISYVVDRNPAKQGKYLPGSRIPIVSEDHIRQERPEYVVILPWNISSEVTHDLEYIRHWDGKFVTAIPEMRIQ